MISARYFIFILAALALAHSTLAAEPLPFGSPPPEAAKSTEEILKAVNKIKGYGVVEWTETNQSGHGRRIFVVWYDPFSGRDNVYVHAYYYDDKGWHLFFNKLLEHSHTISVEMPVDKDELRFRGVRTGAIIHTEPLDKVPKYYEWYRKQE